jgi:hypothetical protein
MNVLIIFIYIYIYVPKKDIFEKIKKRSSLIILQSSLGLSLSSQSVKCVKDVACKSTHNNFYKKK